ncbi:replication factor C subunit 3-like isoform X2 [Schistocerca gregaria]|uniref:replication factor C subunit 3-like isoform X2 n=1 Tax=Schistocerca gregaria TaxID=7010 RepID=UPI00211EE701|nr:replication factor C subunit 3-like isoform X2 [Schistocerca gregaria]
MTLESLDYHLEMAEALKNLATSNDFPHMLFYGPSGAGKKTRTMALLRQIFGPDVEKLRVEKKSFVIPNRSTSVEITILVSPYHIELSLSECMSNDRLVVQEVIKSIAYNQRIGSDSRKFKVIILNEVDVLTRAAQHALRRTMEKCMVNCRIFMNATSITRVIEALRSRCLCLRVGVPDHESISSILQKIGKSECLNVPKELAERISHRSDQNLRRAVLMLELAKLNQYPFSPDQLVQPADWECFVDQLAKMIIEQQTTVRLLAIREKIYELLTHCVPASLILKTLAFALLEKVDDELKHQVILLAAKYEHRMNLGLKPIFHLEAFIAKFMEIYKKYWLSIAG